MCMGSAINTKKIHNVRCHISKQSTNECKSLFTEILIINTPQKATVRREQKFADRWGYLAENLTLYIC